MATYSDIKWQGGSGGITFMLCVLCGRGHGEVKGRRSWREEKLREKKGVNKFVFFKNLTFNTAVSGGGKFAMYKLDTKFSRIL